MLVLFDQGTPVPLRPFLGEHRVETAYQRGWDKLKERRFAKGRSGSWVRSFGHSGQEHPLPANTIAIVVLGNPQWPVLRHHVDRVVAAVNVAKPGTYCEVEFTGR